MIVGYHLIMTASGFWLPNDPRGSWSDFVGSWDLVLAGGPATREKVVERRSHAADPHDREKRLATKAVLQYPPVVFSGVQARAIGRGFQAFIQKSWLPVWACAIMPDHIHLVVGRFRYRVEKVAELLKQAATGRLMEEDIHPFGEFVTPRNRPPKCFAVGEWKGFLDPDDVDRCVRYVEGNPVKAGLPPQSWSFVTAPDRTDWESPLGLPPTSPPPPVASRG